MNIIAKILRGGGKNLSYLLAGAIALCFAQSVSAAKIKEALYSVSDGNIGSAPALVFPGVKIADIKDSFLGCHFRGLHITNYGREGKGWNIRKSPAGDGIRVEYQVHDAKFIKCVIVDLADGEGGVYAKKIGTGYKEAVDGVEIGCSFGDDLASISKYEVYGLFVEPPALRRANPDRICEKCVILKRYSLIPYPREIVPAKGECRADVKPKFVRVSGIPAEGYELSVTPDGVTVRASDAAGEFYAKETLRQLSDGKFIPCCEIKDSPRFRWRGVQVDDARHFIGKEAIKRTIDEMARYKFNVFHWHLTEDPSWRIDVPGYPKLLDYGDQYLTDKNQKRLPDGPRAGKRYYTADDIREVVAYAAERHIKIVPEIDFPGHFYAVLCAYPEFACNSENVYKQGRWPMVTGWKEGRDPMCVGNPDAVKFVEAALDAVCDLFPDSDIIHIGGDESHFEFWKDCPKCQALMKREGMKKLFDIQAWLTRRVVKRLEARGRRAIGWDEILEAEPGVLPQGTMGMRWHPRGGGGRSVRAAKAGHEIVNSTHGFCYFDQRQGLNRDPYRYLGGNITVGRVYAFDPLGGFPAEVHSKVIGGQCCNWGEFTFDGKGLEWKLWPRALAMAEVLWTYPDMKKRNYMEFKRRAAVCREEMVKRGVNAAPIP